jgi:hypothetical protein
MVTPHRQTHPLLSGTEVLLDDIGLGKALMWRVSPLELEPGVNAIWNPKSPLPSQFVVSTNLDGVKFCFVCNGEPTGLFAELLNLRP